MKMYFFTLSSICVVLLGSCKDDRVKEKVVWNTKKRALENQVHNQLLDVEKEAGWKLLFDGETLKGWHLYNDPESTASSMWRVKNGELHCNATNENKKHGDLVTDLAYENYELAFEWKIAHRGNSGVFINVQEKPQIPTTYQSGPEYQLLDPAHMDSGVALKRPGCLYGFAPQLNMVNPKPAGQWNHSRIKQQNGAIAFYLNGVQTATEDFNSAAWKQKVATSGFGNYPQFGIASKGKIALQNWYFEVWFRNMKIRKL